MAALRQSLGDLPARTGLRREHSAGRTESCDDEQGRYRVRWIPETVVKGMAYDTPILGYRVATCNMLRLWKAEAVESFDFEAFNSGDYYGAVEDKVSSETYHQSALSQR